MPSTFSPSLRIELIGDGEQSGVWGQTTNNNLGDLLEQAIAGRTALNVTAGNLTLTSLNGVVDEARSAVLAVTGTPGVTRILTIPNVKKTYTVINSTANIVQIKTASGSAYDCAPLSQSYVNCDGVNVVTGRSITDGANVITSLAAPFNSPSFTGNVGIGTATATLPLTIGDSTLPAGATIDGQMISSDVVAATALLSIRRSSASGNPGLAQFTSSGTAAVPTAVALNRGLGRNDWLGFDGTNYINAAAITTAVDGAVSAGVVPGRMVFSTSTTNTPVERMRITSSGAVGIGTTTPFTSSTTFDSTSAPLIADAGYYGGGAYYNSTDWFNTNSSQGGWAIRNTGGVFTLYTGPSPGVAGTAFTDFAERVRVTSSGDVGIGTSSPGAALHVAGAIAGAPTGSGVLLGLDGSNYGAIQLNGSAGGYIDFSTSGVDSKGRIIYANSDNSLAFSTDGAERMRITNTGSVYIGTASPVAGTKAAIDWNASTEYGLVFKTTNATYNAGPILFLNSVGAGVGNISQSETIVSYNSASDYRLKENVLPMTGALAKVAALKPVTYTWKLDGSSGQGFIAHELQEVVPDCVTGTKDAVDKDGNPKHQGVDTSFLVATLTAAIQEQQAIISAMEARLAALESK
jgi:hypothetical protein